MDLNDPRIILAIIAWTTPWKALALWRAATKRHKFWFVLMLLINTFALLEILYYFFLHEKGEPDFKKFFKRFSS